MSIEVCFICLWVCIVWAKKRHFSQIKARSFEEHGNSCLNIALKLFMENLRIIKHPKVTRESFPLLMSLFSERRQVEGSRVIWVSGRVGSLCTLDLIK